MALRLFRILFFALLVTTAVGKLLDNRGFADVIATYQLGIPALVRLPLGLAVSLLELWMAALILQPARVRLAAQLTVLLHAGYLSLAVLTNLRGLHLPNCGCFGVFLARPMDWTTVAEDVVLLGLAGGFLQTATRRT